MQILAQMGGYMLPPDEPSLDSIERNRRWNREERRKVARSLMNETIDTIVSVMEFSRHTIADEFQNDLAGIEEMSRLRQTYGEDKCRRWLTVLSAEARRANGEVI